MKHHPLVLRFAALLSLRFEYQCDEWDYRGGVHLLEANHCVTLEPSVHPTRSLQLQATIPLAG
jgi:hypothetical protein